VTSSADFTLRNEVEDHRVKRNDPWWRNPSLYFLFVSRNFWNYLCLDCQQLLNPGSSIYRWLVLERSISRDPVFPNIKMIAVLEILLSVPVKELIKLSNLLKLW